MQFRYTAYNLGRGIVRGRVDARTVAEARALVVQQGYRPLGVSTSRGLPRMEELFPSFFRVTTGELSRFCRHLATMISSGGNLLRALEMLQRETHNGVMRLTLDDIRKTLDGGGSLSAALREHPTVFTPLFVSVVEAGEYTGRLAPSLGHLAEILETENEAKKKAVRTMMYPVAIVALAVVTMAVLMFVAMPPMLKVFERMGAETPLVTRVTIGVFNFVREKLLHILIGAMAGVGLLALARRVPGMRYFMDAAQARVPVLGAVFVSAELARLSRTMAMLLEAGVSLSTALELGIKGCRNREMARGLAEAEESLMSGHGLTESLRRYAIFPTLFVELLMIGEESNSFVGIMRDAAATYQKQLEQRLDGLLGMIEPASTLVVGGVVGLMAFSMFVPIYSGLSAFK